MATDLPESSIKAQTTRSDNDGGMSKFFPVREFRGLL